MACLTYNSSKVKFNNKEYSREELLDLRSELCGRLS